MIEMFENNKKIHCCYCIYFSNGKLPCYAHWGYILRTIGNNQDYIILRSSLIK